MALAPAEAPVPPLEDDDEKKEDVFTLGLEVQSLDKEAARYVRELEELAVTSKLSVEHLEKLQDRVGGVSTELGLLKAHERDGTGPVTTVDQHQELGTLRDLTPLVTSAFRRAVAAQFSDAEVMTQLANRRGRTTAVSCRVYWGQEHASWKVLDTDDGTEMTFEALLQASHREAALSHVPKRE